MYDLCPVLYLNYTTNKLKKIIEKHMMKRNFLKSRNDK